VRVRKRFGQHFLTPVWVNKVVAAIAPQPDDAFVEIGPGLGALTSPLACAVREVVAIEIDRDLAAALPARVPGNVRVITGDVLDVDIATLLPDATRLRVAGNLPYNISSPIIFALLDAQKRDTRISDATLMLQREVADRLAARPGTRDYGVLTVLVGLRARVSSVLVLPPGAFRPPPAVTSALVRIEFLPADRVVAAPSSFVPLVRRAFMKRRKTIANALTVFAAERSIDIRKVLDVAGIDHRRRPETLTIDEIVSLARHIP
jgi:16S rRNA (adenine1518-N6/adenine1519-N6)-dimethyltransferase